MAPEEEEPAPSPAPYKSQRSLPLRVPPLFVPLPCVPAFEPPVYCDKSTGLFGSGLLPVVEVVEPVPDPEPLRRIGPFGVELLPVPEGVELVPDPVPPKSTGPFGVELPPVPEGVELVPDPVPLNSTGPFDCEPPVPAVEPSVGLPPLKTIPGGEETPGSKTAVIVPKPPKESCPNPASIARGSRRSITASRGACVRGGAFCGVAPIHWFFPRTTSWKRIHPLSWGPP